MANTLLATNRAISATSNPQTNIEQANNTNGVQQQSIPTPSNVSTQSINQQSQGNTINPITIPIQIQPEIQAQPVQQNTANNIQSLQVSNQQQQVNTPKPQTYSAPTTNNTISYDQIYASYQSQYGTNSNNSNSSYTSGIKKTSIGTTIVTPTVTNTSSPEYQYQSQYSNTINGLIGTLLTELTNGFTYDPSKDTALKVATEYASNTTLQNLAGSGVLNSSSTNERVARVVSELIPTYEQKAHDRWLEGINQLASTAQLIMNYDNQQFNYWKDAKDREFQNKEFEYKKKQDALTNSWKRVDELGYVDNEASTILGVPVGTLSKDAREQKEQREYELQKMREQNEIEYKNNVALAKLKSELDKQSNKELTEYKYQLKQKYNSSKNSKDDTNYKKYDEIIKNRYASYDSMSQQYIVPDEETYSQLGDYLDSLYANGLISGEELSRLSAKYSKYGNQISLQSSNSNESTGLNDSNLNTWIKALDGDNKSLDKLSVNINGQKKSFVRNEDARNAVNTALTQIKNGSYKYTNNQQLMNDLKNGKFGNLHWGL